MVLIQLLLPASGAEDDGLAPLAETGRSWRTDSTASRRICDHPQRGGGPPPMAIRKGTMSSWWKS